jgi:general secretion pathway protein D
MKRITLLTALVALAGFSESARAQVVNSAAPTSLIAPTTAIIPLGPTLDVLPNVSADGYTIQMNLIPTLTEFLGYDSPGAFQTQVGQLQAPLPLPRFRVRQVTTSAIVWDGQTIVLGGLITEEVQKTKDKVPIMGDLPLIGRLFRSETSYSSKKNLMIFVTPTLIDPAGNKIHSEDNLPYDPNKIPAQTALAQ